MIDKCVPLALQIYDLHQQQIQEANEEAREGGPYTRQEQERWEQEAQALQNRIYPLYMQFLACGGAASQAIDCAYERKGHFTMPGPGQDCPPAPPDQLYLPEDEAPYEGGTSSPGPILPPPRHGAPRSPGKPGRGKGPTSPNSPATILGKTIPVTIKGGTPAQQQAIRRALDAAISDINNHSKALTPQEKKIIQNIKGITVQSGPGWRTGIKPSTGIYNLLPTYVQNSDTHWLASTIAHDAYHVLQYQQSGNSPNFYNAATAANLERGADNFEIQVGAKLGLSPAQLQFLQNDTHTAFNTGAY